MLIRRWLMIGWKSIQMMVVKVIYSFQKLNKIVMPSIVEDELSFSSNDSTLIERLCARHNCKEGCVKNGEIVVFDINPRTGNKFAQCRACKTYVNNVSNHVNNPRNNKKVNFTLYISQGWFQLHATPFGAALDSEGLSFLEFLLMFRNRNKLLIEKHAMDVNQNSKMKTSIKQQMESFIAIKIVSRITGKELKL